MPTGRRGDGLPVNLMTDYMDKMSSKWAKRPKEEVCTVEALRNLIIGEFAKVMAELKKHRKDVSGVSVDQDSVANY